MARNPTPQRELNVRRKPSLQVLERTLLILDLFTEQQPAWTTTEIARVSHLPVPTVYRILTVLRRRAYLTQDEHTKRFRLGVSALLLGERARAVVDLRSIAHPLLQQLCQHSGETALLTVLNEARDRSVCLERAESSHSLRLSVEPGRQLPLHAGASQKVLLAFLPEEEIERILAGPLEPLCRNTIVDPEVLRVNLAEIRRRGYASSFEETNVGVWGIAMPIFGADGQILGAIGLAGPSARLSRKRVKDQIQVIRVAVDQVTESLGTRELSGASAQPRRSKN